MHLTATANNGERCYGERHRFRIGVDDREATEFSATATDFHALLCDALIAHGASGRKTDGGLRRYVFLQVLASASARWRNVQNAASGAVVALYFDVAQHEESGAELYRLACNSVQMARDIDSIAGGLAGEVK